ncbi:MAG: DUF4189 domain-containing protein [Actinomycetia bacterium]|nr:DUF4189 domain-containing protein [Actinomycetes bacterium]MCH9701734.1 DUF4189 domain-containing protein [Actinomycetes bacterium]MCH9760441.1 DUF4189 domain-containing protein [Actinomycetes bacterium]
MARYRLFSGIVAGGVFAAGVSAGTAWAGGPAGVTENVDHMSAAVGTGVFANGLMGFIATGATNEEAMANVIAKCSAEGGMYCTSDMATNEDNCIGSFADPVNMVVGGGAGATVEEARQNAIQEAAANNMPVSEPDVFVVISDCWQP